MSRVQTRFLGKGSAKTGLLKAMKIPLGPLFIFLFYGKRKEWRSFSFGSGERGGMKRSK